MHYGCALEDGRIARHEGAQNIAELRRLQGSKYVQGDTGDTFSDCARQLKSGRLVLYTGTPCQIAGLKRFLAVGESKLSLDNLLTCDLVCHGTTSPRLFSLYLTWLQQKIRADSPINDYIFRSKHYGWALNYSYSYSRKGKTHAVYGEANDDPYYAAFLSGQHYRKCCYECHFASANRPGDFTIGDYWGIEHQHPAFNDPRGVSVLLMNTEKAETFFNSSCMDKCEWIESTYEQAAAENMNLQHPSVRTALGKKLAVQVDEALRSEDAELIFAHLLKQKITIGKIAKKILPLPIVTFIRKLRGKRQ